MPLTLVIGPANAAKARVVLDAYRASADRDPILVVPTLADADHYRRELAAEGAVFGVEVLRFGWLMREIGRRAGLRERALGALTRERVAAAAVRATRLERLAASAATPGFAAALVRLCDELEQARIDPRRLYAAVRAQSDDPGRRAYGEEVAALYGAYRRMLERLGRRDEPLVAAAALDALRLAPERWGATPVCFYGFDDLEPLQLDAIDTLANHAGADVTFSLTYEPGRSALDARATTYQELLALGAHVVGCDPRADHYAPHARPVLHHLERSLDEPQAPRVAAGAAVRTLEGGGERAEAELVAAHVARLLREGWAPEEIAIVHRGLRGAAALLEGVLRDLGVPAALEREVRAGHTALGRAIVALLRCAVLDGDADDLLTYLRTPGLLEVAALADRLEAQVRREGVRSAAQARALWERERWPLEALDRVRAAHERGPAALCERLDAELGLLLGAPWRRTAPVLEGPDAADAQVAARLRAALGELRRLPGPLVPEAAELATVLADLRVWVGTPPGPGRVTVADPLRLRARRVRAVFCMGLQEGVFPAPGRPEPFLSDAERRALNAAGGLRLRLHEDRLAAERFLFYVTASRATELLVLSWHVADDEGAPVVRSLLVDDVADVIELGPPERRALGAAGFEPDLAPTGREAQRASAAAAPEADAPGLGVLRSPAVLEPLATRRTWSASALEAWTACPVRWFVERLLRPEGLVPDPEPMVRGQFAHRVLEQAFRTLAADGRGLTPERLPEARALVHEALGRFASEFRISVNPERLRSAVRRLEVDLVAYLEHAAHAGTEFVPTDFELGFGGPDDEHPPLELFEGELVLQGRIDRIDRSLDGGQATVYDYKGRTTASSWEKWGRDGRLQLPLYMLAVRQLLGVEPAGGLYQPLGADDPRPRGIVRDDADTGLDIRAKDRQPAEQVDAVMRQCARAAHEAVGEIRRGALRSRPETCTPKGCAYPTICRCET